MRTKTRCFVSNTYEISYNDKQKESLLIVLPLCRKIEHINIIKLLAYIESESLEKPRILLFEQISPISVAHILYDSKQQLSALQVCSIAYDVILALQYLHSQFIVHNYINAQCIYSLESKTIISDFQYAQDTRLRQEPISSITSQLPWMAPAQAEGALPDVASDIYRCD